MKIRVKLKKSINILRGRIDTGYVNWILAPDYKMDMQDDEGNIILSFKLPALKAGDIFELRANLLFHTHNLKIPLLDFSFKEYPLKIIHKYCKESKYWQISNPKIQQIVNHLRSESGDNVKEFLRLAFEFVRNNIILKRNLKRRLGAVNALIEKKGDCDEFSDLFITISRAAKIPARRVLGYYIMNSHDYELHAWAEVFIPHYNAFVPFDVSLNLSSKITDKHIVRQKMASSDKPPIVFLKYKGSENTMISLNKNDLDSIEKI
ncbi:MAG: transglutaminase-like domain-containing protein [Candidatus Helarchaeota archaeon]